MFSFRKEKKPSSRNESEVNDLYVTFGVPRGDMMSCSNPTYEDQCPEYDIFMTSSGSCQLPSYDEAIAGQMEIKYKEK